MVILRFMLQIDSINDNNLNYYHSVDKNNTNSNYEIYTFKSDFYITCLGFDNFEEKKFINNNNCIGWCNQGFDNSYMFNEGSKGIIDHTFKDVENLIEKIS